MKRARRLLLTLPLLLLLLLPFTGRAASPTGQPTAQPSRQPSAQPSSYPTSPSGQPSRRPSGQPTVEPSRGKSAPPPPITGLVPNYFSFIPEAFATGADATLVKAKIALATALGAFLLALSLSSTLSPSTFWVQGSKMTLHNDIGSSRLTLILLRVYILVEIALLGILLFYLLLLGSPLPITSAIALLPDGRTDWLFSFWRPVTSLVLVSAGIMATTAPFPKLVCLLGCCWEVIQNLVSMVQLNDYEQQVVTLRAPRGKYTRDDLMLLYWRDVVALGVSFAILLHTLHLITLQGVFLGKGAPPYVTYFQIRGGLSDRSGTMRDARDEKLRREIAEERQKERQKCRES